MTDSPLEAGSEGAAGPLAIGVDVGGSGVKAAVVDTASGRLVSERLRVPTPTPSTPDKVSATIGRLVRRLVKSTEIDADVQVGVGLPGVTAGGRLLTAANIDPAWVDYPFAEKLAKILKRPVSIVNDADAAGIAEMRFGIGQGKPGVVIFLTLGHRCRFRRLRRRDPRAEHRIRSDGDPRPSGRAAIRICFPGPPRTVLEGMGDGRR